MLFKFEGRHFTLRHSNTGAFSTCYRIYSLEFLLEVSGDTQKGQSERYKFSLHHVCVSVISCILFGDLGGFYYGILSFKGRCVCVCVCVRACVRGRGGALLSLIGMFTNLSNANIKVSSWLLKGSV